jgi:hypothetical protein
MPYVWVKYLLNESAFNKRGIKNILYWFNIKEVIMYCWDVMPYRMVNRYCHCRGINCRIDMLVHARWP